MNIADSPNHEQVSLHVLATDDLAEDLISDLVADLTTDVISTQDDGRVCLRAADAPSWIRLIAEADTWINLVSLAAGLYVAELVKESAKESWKSRAKAIAAMVRSGSKLRELAKRVLRLKTDVGHGTEIGIALPRPHIYFGTHLHLSGQDVETLELELALFGHYLPAIKALLNSEGQQAHCAATGYFLKLADDGSLHISWFSNETFARHDIVISLDGNPR